MAHPKLKAKRKIIKEYRPSDDQRKGAILALVGYITVIILFVYLGFSGKSGGNTPFFVAILLGFLFSITCFRAYYYAFIDRIVIMPEGILVEGWYTAFADWDSLEYFETHGNSSGKIEGIISTHPVTSNQGSSYNLPPNFIPLSHVCQINHRFKWSRLHSEIALDEFAETPLGQDLLHYAPHLFENEKDKRS